MGRIRAIAFWAAAPLTGLLLYWPGLTAWFQKDDFAWLGLYKMIHSPADFWNAMFHPYAQGTIRTLSERVFYTSFFALFGMTALPYRCWAFLTFAAAVVMLAAVATRLTGSRAAGFWAALLWTVNGSLAVPLSWTAVYHELLCTLVFLVALWLLIRYAETGDRRFYIRQWIVYLLGFGVLEQNVVYPAIAAVYALCCARHVFRKTLAMFIPAALYTAVHLMAAPLASGGPYKMFWDASVFRTLWTYWKIALGPSRLILFRIYPSPGRSALTAVLMAGLVGFLAWQLRQGRYLAAFLAAWFLIVLAPLLPLRDHIMDYYLTIPLIGLAMLAAWAMVCGWRSGMKGRVTVSVLAAVYLCVNIPLARVGAVSFHDGSHKIRAMVESVVRAVRARPQATAILTGVDPDMFWSAILGRPFRLYDLDNVFLRAEDRAALGTGAQQSDLDYFFLSQAEVRAALEEHRALILDISGGAARDVTDLWRR